MNLKELIILNDKIVKICGWKSVGGLDIGYNMMEIGDRYIHQDIHPDAFIELVKACKEIESKILSLSSTIKGVTIYERDDETDPYKRFYVSVELKGNQEMKLAEYKKWLIHHMKMKITATELLGPFNSFVDAEHKGFTDALNVMIAFVEDAGKDDSHMAIPKGANKC